MKKIILPAVISIVIGIVGFYIGLRFGYDNGVAFHQDLQSFKTVEEIRDELHSREQEVITKYLGGKAGISKVDEGSLFKVKYVQYFEGNLTNSASVATAKDIKVNVDFYSKTGSVIGNQQFVIYEFVRPGQVIKFKERINVPDHVEDFKFQIVEALAE